jgi:hypothetical protein
MQGEYCLRKPSALYTKGSQTRGVESPSKLIRTACHDLSRNGNPTHGSRESYRKSFSLPIERSALGDVFKKLFNQNPKDILSLCTRLQVGIKISIRCASCHKFSQDHSNATVGSQLGVEAGGLAGGEFGHAAIVAVVHVVIYERLDIGFDYNKFRIFFTNGVHTAAGASVAANGASRSS